MHSSPTARYSKQTRLSCSPLNTSFLRLFRSCLLTQRPTSVQILAAFLVLYWSEKLVSVRCLCLPLTKTWRMKKNDEGLGGEWVCKGHNGEIWPKFIYCPKCDCFIIGNVDFASCIVLIASLNKWTSGVSSTNPRCSSAMIPISVSPESRNMIVGWAALTDSVVVLFLQCARLLWISPWACKTSNKFGNKMESFTQALLWNNRSVSFLPMGQTTWPSESQTDMRMFTRGGQHSKCCQLVCTPRSS